ncbi:hypothetical protein N9S32_00640 [Candidatus Actinomarina]|nr:hypothetical protein [Candidatus Actinomarina sp.]
MLKNKYKFETLIKSLFIVSIFLSFLDAYQLFNIPLNWIGGSLTVLFFVILYFYENMKIPSLIIMGVFVALLPTFFKYQVISNLIDGEIYTLLRVFSFLSFIFIFYVTSKSKFNYEIINALEKIYVLLLSICIYTFLAQLFNFFEPTRNRPGTGILGFDAQVNFWISGSHRMVGTFREPVFLVSLLFPVFLALHFKKVQPIYFYILSGIAFGLTKSEYALILVIVFSFIQIISYKFSFKIIFFVTLFLICFFIPIKECDISPKNIECPEISNITIETLDSSPENIEGGNNNLEIDYDINEIIFDDQERSDIFRFSIEHMKHNIGFGFQGINQKYTKFLAKNVQDEMYLTNRTLPEYLKIKYLSNSFGTGRYFLTYENINIQNNFLFNFFSIGFFYLLAILLLLIYLLFVNFKRFLYVSMLIFTISLSSIEDLLPIFGLCLGLVFTMVDNED